jgi:hypothetical protein
VNYRSRIRLIIDLNIWILQLLTSFAEAPAVPFHGTFAEYAEKRRAQRGKIYFPSAPSASLRSSAKAPCKGAAENFSNYHPSGYSLIDR